MLMLSVTMLRKADRLGFFQVVQCRSCLYPGYAIHVWLVSYYRDAYICILYCRGFVIVWARWLSFLAQLRLVRNQLQLVGNQMVCEIRTVRWMGRERRGIISYLSMRRTCWKINVILAMSGLCLIINYFTLVNNSLKVGSGFYMKCN